MSTRRILVIVSDSLAAVGLMGGIIGVLGFFAYAAFEESGVPMSSTPIEVDVSPSTNSSPSSSPAPSQSNLPPLPIEINVPYRHLSNDGYVAQFHNTSANLLRVVFDLQSDATHTFRTEVYEITPDGTIEIGWDRSWKLSSGDTVTLSCDGYLTGTWTMP